MKFKVKKGQALNHVTWLEEISSLLSEVSLAQVETFRRINQIQEKIDRWENKEQAAAGQAAASRAAGGPESVDALNELKRKIDRLDIKVSTLAALDASLSSINENLVRLGSVDQRLQAVDSKLATLINKAGHK